MPKRAAFEAGSVLAGAHTGDASVTNGRADAGGRGGLAGRTVRALLDYFCLVLMGFVRSAVSVPQARTRASTGFARTNPSALVVAACFAWAVPFAVAAEGGAPAAHAGAAPGAETEHGVAPSDGPVLSIGVEGGALGDNPEGALRLTFSWAADPPAAAAFVAGRTLHAVFDRPAGDVRVDQAALAGVGDRVLGLTRLPQADATVLAFRLSDRVAKALSEGHGGMRVGGQGWSFDFGAPSTPQASLRPSEDGTGLVLPRATRAVEVSTPDLLGPVLALTYPAPASLPPRDLVDVVFGKAAQGGLLRVDADGLSVQPNHEGLAITRPNGGLRLSEGFVDSLRALDAESSRADDSVAVAEAVSHAGRSPADGPAEEGTAAAQEDRRDQRSSRGEASPALDRRPVDTGSLRSRASEAALNTSPAWTGLPALGRRPPGPWSLAGARSLEAARLWLANGMTVEAKALLQAPDADHRDGAEKRRLLAVAALLDGKVERAEELLREDVGEADREGPPEALLWRGATAAARSDWPEAWRLLRAGEPALATYPRALAVHLEAAAINAALETGDAPAALARARRWPVEAPANSAAAALLLAQARAFEASGRHDLAEDARRKVVDGAFLRPAQQALLASTDARLEAGSVDAAGAAEALAGFATERPVTDAVYLARLAELERAAGVPQRSLARLEAAIAAGAGGRPDGESMLSDALGQSLIAALDGETSALPVLERLLLLQRYGHRLDPDQLERQSVELAKQLAQAGFNETARDLLAGFPSVDPRILQPVVPYGELAEAFSAKDWPRVVALGREAVRNLDPRVALTPDERIAVLRYAVGLARQDEVATVVRLKERFEQGFDDDSDRALLGLLAALPLSDASQYTPASLRQMLNEVQVHLKRIDVYTK